MVWLAVVLYKYSPCTGAGIDERGVILPVYTASEYKLWIMELTVILTIPPATHAFDLCSRYSIDQSQIVAGPDPSAGAGELSLNREQNGLESY